ncbi:MAG: hypothetical protein HOH88_01455 [Flavobacteriales bacterium]|nr:hypothetical protein [Flavobacteriales bacterium]
MSYQNPQILYFLFAIAIPIFIHLFNLRKHKVVYFSNVKFLQEIQSEKKKRSTLKQLLILLSRILAISAIVIAFANPYIPNKNKINTENTFIYIDNSFSMDNLSVKGRLLDNAKEDALKIIENSKNTNQFWILTNDFSSSENFAKNKEESIKYILSIKSSSKVRNSNDVLEKQTSLIKDKSTLFFVSDFQKSSSDLSDFLVSDSIKNIVLLPQEKQTNTNISIDSCYLKNPINKNGNTTSVFSIVSNHSEEKLEDLVLNLEINNKQKTQQFFNLLPSESKTIELQFVLENKTINKGKIIINDNPITYDNNLFFVITSEEKININQISESENKNLKKIFNSEEEIKYESQFINQLDYSKLSDQNIIFINELSSFSSGFTNSIVSYINNGGYVCVIPKTDADIDTYNSFLSKLNTDLFSDKVVSKNKVSKLNLNQNIFNNVFNSKKLKKDINLPSLETYYKLRRNKKTIKENIFTLENNDDFLSFYPKGKGGVYLFTSPLSSESNNFSKHALFVTTFYSMAINSLNTEQLYYLVNTNQNIKLSKTNPEKQNIFHLKSEDIDVICDYTNTNKKSLISTYNPLQKSGFYDLYQEDEFMSTLAFNYRTSESKTNQFSSTEIENFISQNNLGNIKVISYNQNLDKQLENINKNTEFWKYLILLSLLFIMTEILLIKTLKS